MRASIVLASFSMATALALGVVRLEPRAARPSPTAFDARPVTDPAPGEPCVGGTLLRRIRDAALVATGGPAFVDAGAGASHVDVDSVLGGRSGVAPGRQARAVRLRLPARVPAGGRLLVLLEVRNGAWAVGETVAVDPTRHAGLDALVAASLGRDVRTPRGRAAWSAALVAGISGGGDASRAAAAAELEGEGADVLHELDAVSVQTLATVASGLEGADPTLASLLEALAATGDATRAREIADVVARDGTEAVLDRLPRLLGRLDRESAAALLAAHASPERPALERRRAARVLARLAATSARGELARLAAGDDADAATEALLGLHALGEPAALEKARRIVRAHLLPARRASPASELDAVLARRSVDSLRTTPLPTGEGYRLMVGGFVLLRSGGEDAAWLRARLTRLDDPTVARFLERRDQEPWSAFDARW